MQPGAGPATVVTPDTVQAAHGYPTRTAKWLLAVFVAFFVLMGLDPADRFNWFLENILVFLVLAVLLASARRFPLSDLSYSLLFSFLVLHTVGAHYSYSHVPWPDWEGAGFERNHFDRVVHFSFGLLLAYPVRELFLRVADTKGFWGLYLPIDLTLAFSAIYEILEWASTLFTGDNAADTFLGSQGDPFDAVKDMGLAGLGAAIAMAVTAFVLWRRDPDMPNEFRQSLRVKRTTPLGEARLRELRR